MLCQNFQISSGEMGSIVDISQLADIFTALQDCSAENINLVTGTHFAPQIAAGLSLARTKGLTLPVLWNTSGYENDCGLDVIDGFTDVYLTDLKTLDRGIATELFAAPDYPDAAAAAILRTVAQGSPVFAADGRLTSGTVVRHLVLPGMLANTRQVLTWFQEHLAGRALLSLMFQYIPPQDVCGARSGTVLRLQGQNLSLVLLGIDPHPNGKSLRNVERRMIRNCDIVIYTVKCIGLLQPPKPVGR